MSTMIFEVTLPATTAPDVVSRQLEMAVDAGPGELVPVQEGQLVIPDLRAPQGSTVVLTLTDIDDAGNRSEPSTLQFVAADTVAPGKPGEMAVRITGEEA